MAFINSGKNRSSESCIQTRNVFKNVLAFVRSRQRIKIATYIATSESLDGKVFLMLFYWFLSDVIDVRISS